MYNPDREGIDHINAYSKSKTELGKILSNFTPVYFKCEDGAFNSIEGYWYWLKADPSCEGREKLRYLTGFKAKQYGRAIGCVDWCDTNKFKIKIKKALWYKVLAMPRLKQLLLENKLPIVHYYSYGQPPKVIEPDKDKWIWEAFSVIKETLLRKTDHDTERGNHKNTGLL